MAGTNGGNGTEGRTMKIYVYTITYINSRGDERLKQFSGKDRAEVMARALDFCRVLDGRIERKTCGGYIMTDSYVWED